MFIDTANITVKAGSGGRGVDTFYRDKFNMKGFPDGGDGGDGGDIVLRVSTNVHTLIDFRYRQLFQAKDGLRGGPQQQHGKNGPRLVIDVPEGTLVYDAGKNCLIRDMLKKGDEIIVAKGGRGGKGNRSHKNAIPGEKGEEKKLFLELKLIADIGIVGLPNAGKSTLMSKMSNAHPKIAAFAFTTKNPVLGVVRYDDGKAFKIAEIPGLIEDSHKGRGLGDKFLRHAERTKLFVHLVDFSKPAPEEVVADYNNINKELRLYSQNLASKTQIIVGNKMDTCQAKHNFNSVKKSIGKNIIPISAKESTGIDRLIKVIIRQLRIADSLETDIGMAKQAYTEGAI
ncbi:MAG: GTPase ObgE [Candidatus Omnitrophica bacterium]|jgi:GTP-binding protein|nr:GTPase ObgE [Candidatus Omnitrophota bacterium]